MNADKPIVCPECLKAADQYRAAKERHPDMMLFVRVGDYYELYDQDAQIAHEMFNLTLTTRNQKPTTAFPYYQLESYLQELLKQGQRAAILDAA